MRQRLRLFLRDRAALWTVVVASLVYLGIYLVTLGDLVIAKEPLFFDAPGVVAVERWTEVVFRTRVAFTFEPVAALYASEHVGWLFSPVNTLLGALLALLVGLNVGFLVFAFRQPRVCQLRSTKGIFAAAPGLLLGFACCGPTLLIALGSAAASVTLGFIALRTFLYPLAVVGTVLALWWNLRRMRPELYVAPGPAVPTDGTTASPASAST